jgi:predicted dehydrogenase
VFSDEAYVSMDLQQKIVTVIRKRPGGATDGQLPVIIEERIFEPGDALKAEILAFLTCIQNGTAPVVSGEAGLAALQTAIQITAQVQKSRQPPR